MEVTADSDRREQVFAIIDREAQQQRSQQGQPQQSPGSGAQGNQPQTGTNQPSPSQQQDDERVASQIDDAPQDHSRAIVPVQSSTVISVPLPRHRPGIVPGVG